MKEHLSSIEHKIPAVLQSGLPKSMNPHQDIVGRVGIDTQQLLSILGSGKNKASKDRSNSEQFQRRIEFRCNGSMELQSIKEQS